MAAVFWGPLDRACRHIHHDHFPWRAPGTPLLLAWDLERLALEQQVVHLLHRATHARLSDAPSEPNREGGAVLAPVLQAHEERIRKRERCRPSGFDFLLLMVSPDLEHGLEGLRRDPARTLEIAWLQVLHLLVGHELPSCDLLLASFSDFCKRSMVNGFVVDVRHMPRDIQEVAYEKGLIPYLPGTK
jgi:hypothetical protein